MINWHTTKEELESIVRIAERAKIVADNHGYDVPYREFLMDLIACHANGCPLALEELLNAGAFDFSHDVWGIRQHINRETGQLEHCFIPRYAARQDKAQ